MELHMSDINVVFDERSAASYLGGDEKPISDRTLQRWRLEGVGPTYLKIGRLVRYRKSDLDNFLEQSTCTSTSMSQARAGDNQ